MVEKCRRVEVKGAIPQGCDVAGGKEPPKGRHGSSGPSVGLETCHLVARGFDEVVGWFLGLVLFAEGAFLPWTLCHAQYCHYSQQGK